MGPPHVHVPSGLPPQNGSQGRLQGADLAELLHQAPSPWRCPGAQDRSEKAQSATDGTSQSDCPSERYGLGRYV